jgi:ankyrin repeat protein
VAVASGKSEQAISLLIDSGADISASTMNDSDIFDLACLNGHELIVRELLHTHGLSMRLNRKGYHPLHYAAACKQGALCVEMLMNISGIDMNVASNVDGRTPMHICAMHGHTPCAQILYANGASVNAKDCDNNTPLHLAAMNGQTSMMSFLIECGANIYM